MPAGYYRVYNRKLREFGVVYADGWAEACDNLGWPPDDCWVRPLRGATEADVREEGRLTDGLDLPEDRQGEHGQGEHGQALIEGALVLGLIVTVALAFLAWSIILSDRAQLFFAAATAATWSAIPANDPANACDVARINVDMLGSPDLVVCSSSWADGLVEVNLSYPEQLWLVTPVEIHVRARVLR